jgi:hypothetical protein
LRNAQNLLPGFRQELVLQQFTNLLSVDEFLLCFLWPNHGDASALELLWVEARSHSKSSSEQAHLLQAEGSCMITSGAHDAEKRDS